MPDVPRGANTTKTASIISRARSTRRDMERAVAALLSGVKFDLFEEFEAALSGFCPASRA